MAPSSHPSIVDGWFREINTQWPGQALTIKVSQILHHEKSLFQDVLVFASETYGNVLVLDGVVQCTERDEFSYQEMITHLPMASHPNPQEVLVIGGGDGGVIREVLKHDTVKHVTLCDIDEAVVRVSKMFLPHMSSIYSDPRVTVFIGDGFKFLPEHENEYDVIITDSSDPVGPAASLFEAPYFTLLKKALREGGHMSTQGECLWLHLPLIKELRETTKTLFPVAEYAFTTIPTYPSGQIGFVCCSLDPTRSVSTPLRKVPDCKYYNSEVHKAAFVLPEFGRAMVEEGKMIMPTFGGVRPGAEGEVGSGVVGGQNKTGKKVLLLGSGFVAQPCAEYIVKHGHELTIACRTLATAEKLCESIAGAKPASVDVSDSASLDAAIGAHDLVVSLIPYTHHAAVIESAIKHKVHVVTTSYVNPAMSALDAKCKEAGVICFNEIGLDPGVDHLYAVKTIHEVKQAGGKILGFDSMCGGLVAPANADNALGYKLSWSARGVLLALRNDAKYWKDGKVVEVNGKDLMPSAQPYQMLGFPAYNLTGYPNRDSTPYKEWYDLPDATDIRRGTLRYTPFVSNINAWVEIGLLNDEPRDFLAPGADLTWVQALAKYVGADEASEQSVVAKLKSFPAVDDAAITSLRSLRILSNDKITARGNMLDTLCALLETELALKEGEQDLVLLQHQFKVQNKDGSINTIASSLQAYGEQPHGPSAMAKLVGVPCGVAVQCIFDGKIGKPGVSRPYDEETCAVLRSELEKEGIVMTEKVF